MRCDIRLHYSICYLFKQIQAIIISIEQESIKRKLRLSHDSFTMENSTETTAVTEELLPSNIPLYSIIISSVVTLECLAAIAFNPLTIAAIFIGGLAKKSATNLFIASLSVSDFLSGISLFCFQVQKWASTLLSISPALVATSWVSATISAIAFPGSLLSSMVIGLYRALATSKPTKYKQLMSPRNAKLILMLQWTMLSGLVFAPVIYNYVSLEPTERQQLIINPPDVYPTGYTTYFTSPLIYVFLFGNALLYVKVFHSYKNFTSRIRSISAESSNDSKSRKLTKTAMIVTTILIVCWMPLAVVSAMKVPDPFSQPGAFLAYAISYESVFIFLLFPSFLNNIIYALQHKDYWRAYLMILGIRRN